MKIINIGGKLYCECGLQLNSSTHYFDHIDEMKCCINNMKILKYKNKKYRIYF